MSATAPPAPDDGSAWSSRPASAPWHRARALPRARRSRRVLAAVVAAVVAVLVLLPDLVGLDRVLPFAVFAALRLPLAVVTWVAGVGLLALRPRWWPALAAVLAVAVVAVAVVLPRAVPEPGPPPGGTDLAVLELNSFEGKADPAAIAATATAARADLVVLPEAGERMRRSLAALLPGWRTWTNVPASAAEVRGIVVASAPRAGDVTARRVDADTRYPWAEVTGGVLGPTRLVAVHLVSPVPRWIGHWPGELEMLQRWCAAPGPALVVGDLNASPDHSTFRSGTAGCVDAGSATGGSLVGTWYSGVPRWLGTQIDHVLTRAAPDGSGPRARSTEVLDLPGSDHRALLVHLRL
ncbi:endonuclease/exonuclease/phosphatase family protein [Actinomycetospora termitidis]|uniref:Endonuclease/exonuclease/phosphatase family protein n=1 Tax=Actinomycetospora termitidis TaxID=3053470 RepID=A0ABT7M5I0_9PSEU|nr:endonuclease/exonuclease/phosphatase family protein [Actinomycetospora sp. Odt1-22]MDL5155711.1 endonuclease/exonuclease/phosphatase family protein [Actinomycetospora sp. Odt1-22]